VAEGVVACGPAAGACPPAWLARAPADFKLADVFEYPVWSVFAYLKMIGSIATGRV